MRKSVVLIVLAACCLLQYVRTSSADQDPYLITDYSRLHPVKVERVVQGRETEQLSRIIREAGAEGKTVSIAGQRHSQGGHTYYKDGIVIDMTTFNKVLGVDPEARLVTVQAGATWDDVQQAVNPLGLSVMTMQSINPFTVGGSVSVNAHGRDIRNGSMIASVESFRLLNANGELLNVSRTEHGELFPLALGGYGLFGVITDVTLRLTADEAYREQTVVMPLEEYAEYFQKEVLTNEQIKMHIGRISIAPDTYLQEVLAKNYAADPAVSLDEHNRLTDQDRWVAPGKLLFQLNRSFDWGKELQWSLQKRVFAGQSGQIVSRNNAMRAAYEFMEYGQPGSNDQLQEYFVPIDRFDSFARKLGEIAKEEKLGLLNITIRYVNRDQEAVLSYAKDDMLALVCLFHAPLSRSGQQRMEQGTRRIVDEVIAHDGSYYLPYIAYPTREQMREVYPRADYFFAKKREYDPNGVFMNYFYENYGLNGGAEE